jgi:hypothetical protein
LTAEFIDPVEARDFAAAAAATSSSKNPLAPAPAPAGGNLSAASDEAPALLINADRIGGRSVAAADASAQPERETSTANFSHISKIFQSTRALPTIYYQENEVGKAKRARAQESGK